MPSLPLWLVEPLWVQFEALLPGRPVCDPAHPLGCHRRRISDRVVFGKLLQALRFGCSYEGVADTTCSATTIRNQWITVHLDSGYDSGKTRALLHERHLTGEIARKGEKAPVQATQRWHIERTNAWHNVFHRLARCYERRRVVVEAVFDLADAITTIRSLIRGAWTTRRWDTRPKRRR